MSKSIAKISAVMLAVMTLLSSIFVVPANAAAGDKVTISFNYCYDTNGNSIRYQQTMKLSIIVDTKKTNFLKAKQRSINPDRIVYVLA